MNAPLLRLGVEPDHRMPLEMSPPIREASDRYAKATTRQEQLEALADMARLKTVFWNGFTAARVTR